MDLPSFFLFLNSYLSIFNNGELKGILLLAVMFMVFITLIIAVIRKNENISIRIIEIVLTWGTMIVTFYFASEVIDL